MADGNQAIAALLLLQSGTTTMDVFSTLNSSPWTAENFGADPEKARSCREYVWHSMAWSSGFSIGAAFVAKSWWPVIGLVITNCYMYWLYSRALRRGAAAGSGSWAKESDDA